MRIKDRNFTVPRHVGDYGRVWIVRVDHDDVVLTSPVAVRAFCRLHPAADVLRCRIQVVQREAPVGVRS